jgi:hypothetical protein
MRFSLIMTLLTDATTLVTRGLYYQGKYGTWDLFWKGAHDMTFGAGTTPMDPSRVYTDFHVHIHRTTDPRRMLREAAKRVDIVAITGRTEDFADNHHTLDTFLESCNDHTVEIEKLGENVAVAEVDRKTLYLIRATEIYPTEIIGVVSVGGKLQRRYERHGEGTLHDTISDARDHTAFWFIDHPFSIASPVIAFRYPTEDEVKRRIEIFRRYDAMIETNNHQNTWWMYLSNEIATAVAQEHGLVGIGNSDSHFRLRDIGLTRTSFPRTMLDTSTEEKFLASLQTAFSQQQHIETGFASDWAFAHYMVIAGKIPAYQRVAVRYNL